MNFQHREGFHRYGWTMGPVGHGLGRITVVATAAVFTLGAGPAGAATLKVNTTSDEGVSGDHTCSLREAIAAVSAPAAPTDCTPAAFGANTIVLGPHRYVLTIPGSGAGNSTGDLNVPGTVSPLTIRGAGEGATTIDATGLGDRALEIADGATVAVNALTITGGHAPDGAPGMAGTDGVVGGVGGLGGNGMNGGGIENDGTLRLDDVAISGNHAGDSGAGGRGGRGEPGGPGGDAGGPGAGGGIYNSGVLKVTDSSITGNSAGNGGVGGAGGVGNSDQGGHGGVGGPGGSAGGILNAAGTLTIVDSTISGNTAGDGGSGGNGGGTAAPSAPSGAGGGGNAGGDGGGILDSGGSLSLTNSTVAGNRAGQGGTGGNGGHQGDTGGVGGGGPGGDGGSVGGLDGAGATDSLSEATVVGNAAGGAGQGGAPGTGGSGNGSSGAAGMAGSYGGMFDTGTLVGMLVAFNPGGNCGGSESDGGHNLSFPDASCPGLNVNPKLKSFQDNGGPAPTIALGPGSPAIDAGPAVGAGCPATDERGVPRPQGKRCDIGAFESATPAATIAAPRQHAHYTQGARVRASYACTDGGIASAIASCTGTVADGQSIDTTNTGSKSFTVTATGKDGAQVSSKVTYTVDPRPPVLTHVAESHIEWREGSKLPTIARSNKRKPPVGTVFSFTLNAPAQVKLVFSHTLSGRRLGGKCVAKTKRTKGLRPCTRAISAGTLTLPKAHPGPDRIAFEGSLSRSKRLRPGRYALKITATNVSGHATAPRLTFKIDST